MGFFDKLKEGATYTANYSLDKVQKRNDEYKSGKERATGMTDAELKKRFKNSESFGERYAMVEEYKKRNQSE